MKAFIDPNGTAYGQKSAPAATAPTSSPAKPTAPPPAAPVDRPAPPAASGTVTDAPIHAKLKGRFLTKSEVENQLSEITFSAQGRSFLLARAIYRDKLGLTSVRDSSGRFWGLAIGDLNMDGSDDAVLVLRTDKGHGSVAWDLAYLPNRSGRLFNVQTVMLPGDLGFGDVVIEGPEVILTPAQSGPNVHLEYSGAELTLHPN